MVVRESPFAALQLVGLLLPVVVLVLRSYLDTFDDNKRHEIIEPESEQQIKHGLQAALLSLGSFMLSALIVLGGLFVENTTFPEWITPLRWVTPLWAVTVAIAFLGQSALVYFWFRRVKEKGGAEVL